MKNSFDGCPSAISKFVDHVYPQSYKDANVKRITIRFSVIEDWVRSRIAKEDYRSLAVLSQKTWLGNFVKTAKLHNPEDVTVVPMDLTM